MNEYSNTFKEIRTSKNYTQTYIASNQLSRSLYAKIEAGQVIPSYTKFLFLLQRLDLGIQEFEYIHNNYSLSAKQNILAKFSLINTNLDTISLNELISLCTKYLKNDKDIFISNILSICKALFLVQSEDDYHKAIILVAPIWERLSKQDTLYLNDIILLSNIFYLFQVDTAKEIVKFAINRLQKYNSFCNIDQIQVSFYLNLSTLLIQESKFDEAMEFIDYSIDFAQKSQLYILLGISYFKKAVVYKHKLNSAK
ncbi:XRE family transcriptional regulator, partial [Listeria monocytogenes]|nr:XRE family transcriptional regulator [Listeria monocytogenes]